MGEGVGGDGDVAAAAQREVLRLPRQTPLAQLQVGLKERVRGIVSVDQKQRKYKCLIMYMEPLEGFGQVLAILLGSIHKVRTHRGGGGEVSQKRTVSEVA